MTENDVYTVDRESLDVTRRELGKGVTAAAVGTAAVSMTAGSVQAQSTQISGTVTDSDGTVGGATVVAIPHDSSLAPLQTTTASDGTYKFGTSDLYGGTNLYHVVARDGTESDPRRGQQNYPFISANGGPPALNIENQWNPNTIAASDGEAITSYPAEIGSVDLSGGAPIYRNSGISVTSGLEYDGVDDELFASNTALYDPGTGPRTYFAVIQDSDPSNNERVFAHTQSDGQTGTPINQWRWYDPGSGIVLECRLNGSNSTSVLRVSGLDDGNPHLVVLTHDGGSETQLYYDRGNNAASDTSTTVGDQPNVDYYVQGAFPNSTNYLDGTVAHSGISSQFWTQQDVIDYYDYLPWT